MTRLVTPSTGARVAESLRGIEAPHGNSTLSTAVPPSRRRPPASPERADDGEHPLGAGSAPASRPPVAAAVAVKRPLRVRRAFSRPSRCPGRGSRCLAACRWPRGASGLTHAVAHPHGAGQESAPVRDGHRSSQRHARARVVDHTVVGFGLWVGGRFCRRGSNITLARCRLRLAAVHPGGSRCLARTPSGPAPASSYCASSTLGMTRSSSPPRARLVGSTSRCRPRRWSAQAERSPPISIVGAAWPGPASRASCVGAGDGDEGRRSPRGRGSSGENSPACSTRPQACPAAASAGDVRRRPAAGRERDRDRGHRCRSSRRPRRRAPGPPPSRGSPVEAVTDHGADALQRQAALARSTMACGRARPRSPRSRR